MSNQKLEADFSEVEKTLLDFLDEMRFDVRRVSDETFSILKCDHRTFSLSKISAIKTAKSQHKYA